MSLLERRRELTAELRESPYDLFVYIKRAIVHSELGYPDLAAGDAYRALLLTLEVEEDCQEYHEPADEAFQKYIQLPGKLRDLYGVHAEERERAEQLIQDGNLTDDELLKLAKIRCYRILSISLLLCGCLKSAWDYTVQGLETAPGDKELLQAQEYITGLAKRKLRHDDVSPTDFPDQGLVRREMYPWNKTHEPNRYSDETLEFLNAELAQVAPKCEAKVTELPILVDGVPKLDENGNIPTNKQLGLFAKEMGALFLRDKKGSAVNSNHTSSYLGLSDLNSQVLR